MTAVLVTVALLATPTYVWLRWPYVDHNVRVEAPKHLGADEFWSPLAAYADDIADWDEAAQLHADLDELQARWMSVLDAIEASALALLADDVSSGELVAS